MSLNKTTSIKFILIFFKISKVILDYQMDVTNKILFKTTNILDKPKKYFPKKIQKNLTTFFLQIHKKIN